MRLERIIAIIMILLQTDKITAKELCEKFEVSIRTIYRDIDAINLAGIPISSISGVNGGVWIMPEYKMQKGIFTKDDLVQILMGTGILSSTLTNEQMSITIPKIQSLIPDEFKDEINLRSSAIAFNFSLRGDKNSKEYINLIHIGINSKRKLSFKYWSQRAEETFRTIEPFQLIFQVGNWYIQGYCQDRADFRMFKLSRMWDLEILEDNFEKREFPNSFFDYNEIMASRAIDIQLEVNISIIDRILDYCSIDKMEQVSEEKYLVNFPFIENEYDYGILLSFGTDCKCISPSFVKEGIEKRLVKMLESYKKI